MANGPSVSVLMAVPYILLRLVDDFTRVPTVIKRAAELASWPDPRCGATAPLSTPVVLYIVLYFFVVSIYCAVVFIRAARRSRGVTRRRMEAISLGSILVGTDLLIAGLTPLAAEENRAILQALGQILGLGSAVAYYLGFAPPPILRRAWQEPELRAFLARAASLPRLPTTLDIVRELERGAANSTGTAARIGLLREDSAMLRFWEDDDTTIDLTPGTHIADERSSCSDPSSAAIRSATTPTAPMATARVGWAPCSRRRSPRVNAGLVC